LGKFVFAHRGWQNVMRTCSKIFNTDYRYEHTFDSMFCSWQLKFTWGFKQGVGSSNYNVIEVFFNVCNVIKVLVSTCNPARNQLGAPEGVKCYLTGTQIF